MSFAWPAFRICSARGNRELIRFSNRVGVYLGLMDDRHPSTDEEQSVHLDIDYPDAAQDLNRGLPLVKWFLAIPHHIVLFFLSIAALFAVIAAWFAILFTGRYPRGSVRIRRRRGAVAQTYSRPGSFRHARRRLRGLDIDDEVVVCCSNVDCQASAALYRDLVDRGYKNVRRYSDGLIDCNRRCVVHRDGRRLTSDDGPERHCRRVRSGFRG